MWKGVVSIFRDYGYRRLRSRARLKFLVADWGIEKFREVLENEYLNRALPDLESPEVPVTPTLALGVYRQNDGRYYVGFAGTVSRLSGTLLQRIADIVQAHGSSDVALTPMQKFIVLNVDESQVEALITAMAEVGLHARPSQWRQEHDGLHWNRVLQAGHRRDKNRCR